MLQLFSRSGAFFLFAALEVVCFYLIINFNSAQQEIAVESWGLYSGRVMDRLDRASRYFSLEQRARQLQEENAELRSRLPNATYTEDVLIDSVEQTIDSLRQRYTFVAANVINKSPLSGNNTYVLDRGYIHGVEKHQGVISENGVVGIVISVSARHARVMSVLHRDFRLTGTLRGKSYFGTLSWPGGDLRYARLSSIPEYAPVAVGDTVETSGYSNIFPAGILVGEVAEIKTPPGENTYDLRIRLFTDYYGLRETYVVRNLLKEDLQQLDELE